MTDSPNTLGLIERLEELHDATAFLSSGPNTGSNIPRINVAGRMAEELIELHNNAPFLLSLARKGLWAVTAKDALDDMWDQFAYDAKGGGKYAGGLSALEHCEKALQSFPKS